MVSSCSFHNYVCTKHISIWASDTVSNEANRWKTLLGLYFSYGISNFVHNPQTGSTSSNFTVLPHCYSGVCLSVTVNYMCILKKIYRKRYTWLLSTCTAYRTCKTPQYTNIILRRNQFYYLLKDAAVKGCLCEGLSLNIYLCSLLCRAVSGCVLSLYCILTFLLVDGATSKQFKNWSVYRTSNGAVFLCFYPHTAMFYSGVSTATIPSANQILSQNISQNW